MGNDLSFLDQKCPIIVRQQKQVSRYCVLRAKQLTVICPKGTNLSRIKVEILKEMFILVSNQKLSK